MSENSLIAYHLVADTWFRAQPGDADYLPEAFEQDGFVHLTHGIEPVLAAGNRYYRSDRRSYLLLTIDLAHVAADVRYDDAARQFPHVYGPIERVAITAVQPVLRSDDGTFLSVGELSAA